MDRNHHPKSWHGIPREAINWHPLVQSCLCDGCGLCVTSCPAKALAFDFGLKIPFVDPLRCLVGCSLCATLCPAGAILLPDRRYLQEIIEIHHLDVVARAELRRRRKRYAGFLPQMSVPDDGIGSRN